MNDIDIRITRDRTRRYIHAAHCEVPGCSRPCEQHEIVQRGGVGKSDKQLVLYLPGNTLMLCREHHEAIHATRFLDPIPGMTMTWRDLLFKCRSRQDIMQFVTEYHETFRVKDEVVIYMEEALYGRLK